MQIAQWGRLELFKREEWVVELFGRRFVASGKPDLASQFPAKVAVADFSFYRTDRNSIYADSPISVVYSLTPQDSRSVPHSHGG